MQGDAVVFGETEAVIEKKPSPLPSRLPSLDGWRALSICLVLGEHSMFTFDCSPKAGMFLDAYFDANLGVRFFFVISGFLITYLLLKEHVETGKISLRNFYARRALRILPVYYIYLAVVFALQLLTPYRQSGHTWAANLTFTTNYAPMNWTTGHLWSLAVEEQFYLLWPLILYFARPQNCRRLLWILSVPIIVAPICRWLSYAKGLPVPLGLMVESHSFFSYCDSLAMGCLAAVLYVHCHDKLQALLTRLGLAGAALGAALVIVPQILVRSWVTVYVSYYVSERIAVPLAMSIQALGFSILILQSIVFPKSFTQLNWPLVTKLGVLSYSIYIWQMLFSNNPARFGLLYPWFMSFRFWWIPVLITSLCSYYIIEKPFMSLRRHFRS